MIPAAVKPGDRRKALVVAEPFGERLATDELEADRGDPRPEEASGHA